MENIWYTICNKYNISSDIISLWYGKLMNNYSDSNRYYHNDNELMSKKLTLMNNICKNKINDFLIFAILFQYYEFDVKHNCSEKNCNAFVQFLVESGINDDNLKNCVLKLLGDDTIDEINNFEETMQYFQDLDLYVLGLPNEEYKKYIALLQKEYYDVDAETYKAMRLKILQTFLTIPFIYSTSEFREKYEANARENIMNEIEQLKK